jgi:transcriptional regulator with XRE-family HTH domain
MASPTIKNSEAQHWVTGSAYDFLKLTAEESAYVDLKLRLSKALRNHRKRRPLSQNELAKKLKSSQSRVAKMERGDPSVTIDLLLRGLILLGVSRSEIAKVLVFEEPKSLLLGDVTVTSTAESKKPFFKKPFFWSTYKFFPGKSFPEKPQRAYSSNQQFDANELIYEEEVAYG